jgi:hypothetical protein
MPRTRAILFLGAVGLIASTAAVASPQFVSTFAGTYSAQTPGTSSGFDALATWSDPGEPGGKPKEVRKIKVLFNPGGKLDVRALPACKASAEDIAIHAVRACPAKTKLGEVRGQGVYAGSTAPFNTFATLFNARRQIIVVVTLDNARGRLLTSFRDDVERDSITVNLKIGKGISLVRFQAHVPPHVRKAKKGRKRRVYFTTPPTCPASGAWTTTFVFSYRDGTSDQHSSPSPCHAIPAASTY